MKAAYYYLTLADVTVPQSIGYSTIIHILLSLIIILHLLSRPRDARSTLLWIFFTSAFPVIGPLAYLLFGINTIPHKGLLKQYSDVTFQKHLRHQPSYPLTRTREAKQNLRSALENPLHLQLDRILDHLSIRHPLVSGNDIQILEPAELALEEMYAAIRSATRHIHLASYIISDDQVGRHVMQLLEERARAGVKVKLLYDAFGSAGASLRLLFWRYRNVPNMTLLGFSQANFLKRKFQLSLRNHRKIMIIDAQTAFIGGINFHDVYLPQNNQPGTIDLHFKVRGPLVQELQYTFLRDWFYMTDTPVQQLLTPEFFPPPVKAGNIVGRLQNSGPTRDETGAALAAYYAAFNLAQRQILIVTPYFIPSEPLILALKQAACRGVDVKILLPSKNNHPTLRLASHAIYAQLLISGVRIFERLAPFIHAKSTIIDDTIAIVGSSNMDSRSLYLNYETNLVIYDASFASNLKASLLHEFSHSEEINYARWRRRPFSKQLLENFFYLFNPIA